MCGRYALWSSTPRIAEMLGLGDVPEIFARYNIAPTQEVPVCRAVEGLGRELVSMRWGLIPAWTKTGKDDFRMINARAETLANRPAFRTPYRRRRCLIPADGFYEWQAGPSGKQPYLIRRKDERPFCFAGLWERWAPPDREAVLSYTIITTAANAVLAPIHNRMPVILDPSSFENWLDPDLTDTATLESLLAPWNDQDLTARPVERYVNNPANDDPRCVGFSASEPLG